MSVFYTKSEACEILLAGTPEESIARIEAEREDRKYCLVTAYTPYCGEEMESYFSFCKDEDLFAFCDELVAECAAEWLEQHLEDWVENGYETYEDAREDYYAGCGSRVNYIPKEEYAKAIDAYWCMR